MIWNVMLGVAIKILGVLLLPLQPFAFEMPAAFTDAVTVIVKLVIWLVELFGPAGTFLFDSVVIWISFALTAFIVRSAITLVGLPVRIVSGWRNSRDVT